MPATTGLLVAACPLLQQAWCADRILLPRCAGAHPACSLCPRAETTRDAIEEVFNKFAKRDDVGLIIINQNIADQIRGTVASHK